jgi:hypothetical protein
MSSDQVPVGAYAVIAPSLQVDGDHPVAPLQRDEGPAPVVRHGDLVRPLAGGQRRVHAAGGGVEHGGGVVVHVADHQRARGRGALGQQWSGGRCSGERGDEHVARHGWPGCG